MVLHGFGADPSNAFAEYNFSTGNAVSGGRLDFCSLQCNFSTGNAVSGGRLDFRSLVAQL